MAKNNVIAIPCHNLENGRGDPFSWCPGLPHPAVLSNITPNNPF
tara:strand:- start:55232 stop:55363 length:132 start_codon:yes stop_codon:yes gene_type:complete